MLLAIEDTPKLSFDDLEEKQKLAVLRLVEQDTLFIAPMGAGKTVIAATAIQQLISLRFGIGWGRALIVAPLKVCQSTWPDELAKWEHLKDLRVSYALGTKANRKIAVDSMSDVVIINYENLAWLCTHYDVGMLFDILIVDEIDKLSMTGGVAFKRLRKHIPNFSRRIGMTGTPVSEGLHLLFGQMFIVDAGETFGRNRRLWLERYFRAVDYQGYKWEIHSEAHAQKLIARAAPRVYYLPVDERPDVSVHPWDVSMPKGAWDRYYELRAELASGEIEASNLAVLAGKLQQVACGSVYVKGLKTEVIHRFRESAFKRYIRDVGENCLVVYWYAYQRAMLERMGVPIYDKDAGEAWNAGALKLMGIHPRSCSHGLNLQAGGSRLLWLTPCWSRRLWDQTNARLARRGQGQTVEVDVMCTFGSVEELMLARLQSKGDRDRAFVEHIRSGRVESP